jgi:hypothetical protein
MSPFKLGGLIGKGAEKEPALTPEADLESGSASHEMEKNKEAVKVTSAGGASSEELGEYPA